MAPSTVQTKTEDPESQRDPAVGIVALREFGRRRAQCAACMAPGVNDPQEAAKNTRCAPP